MAPCSQCRLSALVAALEHRRVQPPLRLPLRQPRLHLSQWTSSLLLDIAADWAEATELLRLSGVKLEESERLEAAGDPDAGAAQDEALWSLQAKASELIVALKIPFQACSFE